MDWFSGVDNGTEKRVFWPSDHRKSKMCIVDDVGVSHGRAC